jgi:hypothetical protein
MNDFDYLDECVGKWERLPAKKLTRKQQVVLDVYGTIVFVEGDGLLHVWSQYGNRMDSIIESFRLARADEIADLLQSTSFCRDIIARTPADAADWRCSEEEERKLRGVELRISDKGPDAREALLEFLPKRKI